MKSLATYPRIAGINYESMNDGNGMRAVIYVSGCPHHCPQCHNPESHDPAYGEELTPDLLTTIRKEIADRPFLQGLTLSGGEPFFQPQATFNLLNLLNLSALRSKDEPPLNLWIYTGYTWEELMGVLSSNHPEREAVFQLLNHTDCLVEGRFEIAKRDITLAHRGSSNQRIIAAKISLNGSQSCAEALTDLPPVDLSMDYDAVKNGGK